MKLKYKTDSVPESRTSVYKCALNMFFDAHYVLT